MVLFHIFFYSYVLIIDSPNQWSVPMSTFMHGIHNQCFNLMIKLFWLMQSYKLNWNTSANVYKTSSKRYRKYWKSAKNAYFLYKTSAIPTTASRIKLLLAAAQFKREKIFFLICCYSSNQAAKEIELQKRSKYNVEY